jgi:HD-like signal output (HDOD) protein
VQAEALGRSVAHAIASRSFALPLMPGIAAEVLASSLDDKSDAARLAQLIQQDQTLATHLLKVVNSPAFRGAAEIVALRQAIARLGMERIREIALTASLSGTLFKPGPYEALGKREWHHALATGLWAKEVSRACRKNVEISYLCGLLHNVGVPVVLNLLTEHAKGHVDLALAESLIRQHGPTTGTMLARDWKLPPPVVATVEHIGDFSAGGPHRDVVAIASAASTIATLMANGGLVAAAISALPPIQHLNLYPDDVTKLLEAKAAVKASVETLAS